MTFEYFLGANSSRGFYSLYSEFCSSESDYLHIIKGGPGTGKSGFMRRIGKAAEEQGYDVEYVLCSGDPESLDGVYIPKLHRGWVDGTAPHVTEPRCFGFDSDYVNLGQFCRTPLNSADKDYVNQLYSRYKGCYSSAYDFLKAAALLRKSRLSSALRPELASKVHRRIKDILDNAGGKNTGSAVLIPRFFHALCCKGDVYLHSAINNLCKQCYVIQGDAGAVSTVMRIAAELASSRTSSLIVCPDPLEPELFDAVLLPELSLAFVSAAYSPEGAEPLLDEDIHPQLSGDDCTEPEKSVREMALGRLKQAKELHDELESFYKAAMNFAALDDFTGEYIKTAVE